jgi:prevent-host-death family protein
MESAMDEVTVGVRELKNHLSEYLRRVRRGQTIVITDHGVAVGRMIPVDQPLEERLSSLQTAGLLDWGGQSLPQIEPPALNRSGKTISDLVVEMREREA